MAAVGASYVEVTYEDGRTEKVKLGAAAMVQIERRFRGRQIPPVESAYFGAWYALGCPGVGSDNDAKFDGWLLTVDAVSDAEAEATVPTLPAP